MNKLKIKNEEGQTVYEIEFEDKRHYMNRTWVPIPDLAPGMYTIHLECGEVHIENGSIKVPNRG